QCSINDIEINRAELHDRGGRAETEILTEADLDAEICVKTVGGNEYHLHYCASRRGRVGIDHSGIRGERKIGAEEEVSTEKRQAEAGDLDGVGELAPGEEDLMNGRTCLQHVE